MLKTAQSGLERSPNNHMSMESLHKDPGGLDYQWWPVAHNVGCRYVDTKHQHLTTDRHVPESTIHLIRCSLHPNSALATERDLIMVHTPRPWLNKNSAIRMAEEPAGPTTTRFHGSVAPAARTAAFIKPAAADDRSHPATGSRCNRSRHSYSATGARATRFHPELLRNEKQSQ